VLDEQDDEAVELRHERALPRGELLLRRGEPATSQIE